MIACSPATLLPSGHAVGLDTCGGVTLTLGPADAWHAVDTVIELW